jgi:hypothetical protein
MYKKMTKGHKQQHVVNLSSGPYYQQDPNAPNGQDPDAAYQHDGSSYEEQNQGVAYQQDPNAAYGQEQGQQEALSSDAASEAEDQQEVYEEQQEEAEWE